MRKILFISVLFIITILYSCKTDFEVNAPWKDMTVVYGLLSQKDSVHYIKINKAFLGNGNSLVYAQNPDSSSYGNNLQVRVEEWLNGSQTNQWYLDTTTIYNKEPGVFYAPDQVLYKFKVQLNEYAEYRLYIKNIKTGKIVSSTTNLVQDFYIEKPTGLFAIFHATNPYQVMWYSAVNGKLYQVVIRFNYWERIKPAMDSTLKSLDWNLGTLQSMGTEGNEQMETEYYGNSFFQFLGDNIAYNPHAIRHVAIPNVEFIFSVASNEFNAYMEVSAPSTGISQEKPQYSNINNGYGLFASRDSLDKKMAIHPFSMDSLFDGIYTKSLNFH